MMEEQLTMRGKAKFGRIVNVAICLAISLMITTQIFTVVANGGNDKKIVNLDVLDTLRMQYVNHDIVVPERYEFSTTGGSEHFSFGELKSPDSDYAIITTALLNGLETTRADYGYPLYINSGYRTPNHNDAVPGSSPQSTHMYGLAADIDVRDEDGDGDLNDDAQAIKNATDAAGATYSYIGYDQWGNPTHVHAQWGSYPPQNYDIELSCPETSKTVEPGGTADFNITVTNNGNGKDTVTLSVSGPPPSDWSATLSTTSLEVECEPGDTEESFTLSVTAPSDAEESDSAEVTVTATSEGGQSPSVTASITVTVTVPEFPAGTFILWALSLGILTLFLFQQRRGRRESKIRVPLEACRGCYQRDSMMYVATNS